MVKHGTRVRKGPDPVMSSAVRQQLVEFFKGDVAKLEAMINQKTPWAEF